MWEEARRARELDRESARLFLATGQRDHRGWREDRHLRCGFLMAVPFFLAGFMLQIVVSKRFGSETRSLIPFFAVMIPVSHASVALWFVLAARLRRRAGDSEA